MALCAVAPFGGVWVGGADAVIQNVHPHTGTRDQKRDSQCGYAAVKSRFAAAFVPKSKYINASVRALLAHPNGVMASADTNLAISTHAAAA